MTLQAQQEAVVTLPGFHVAFGAPSAPSAPISLPIPLVGQRGSFWCWAACAEMVDRWRKGGAQAASQCSLASSHVASNCCDEMPPSDQCDRGLSADGITQVWHELGYANATENGSIDLTEVDSELGAQRPVQIGLTGATGGRVVLIVGVNAGATQYTVNDPLPLNTGSATQASAARVQAGLGQGAWTHTWTSI